ncbi:unnamed protein product [Cercopithifilaria johnstoni]|uniref:LRRCT domain-containing protein n=1 Tax=Cercopithifilaria johnstoni TaxID=2874296 RepID=A0A8J2M4N1_9BILA|nr:unnamed protein product [Cercopithifilaria johnstoni]
MVDYRIVSKFLPKTHLHQCRCILVILFPPKVVVSALAEFTYKRVSLHGNPLDCTCYVEELKRHMLDRYVYRRELQYEHTCCATPEHLQGTPVYRLDHVADCPFLFGARYGLSQFSEIEILFLFLIIFALSAALLILVAYKRSERRQKKYADITESQSRIALTLSHHLSNSPTSLTEPLSPLPKSPISGISTKMPSPPPSILPII